METCPRCQQEDGLAQITITRVCSQGANAGRADTLLSVEVCLDCETEIVAEAERKFNRTEE